MTILYEIIVIFWCVEEKKRIIIRHSCGPTSGLYIMTTLLIQEVLVQSLSQQRNSHPIHKTSLLAALICSQKVKSFMKRTNSDGTEHTTQRHMAEHKHSIPEENFQKCPEVWKKKMEETLQTMETTLKRPKFQFCDFLITEVLLSYPHFFFVPDLIYILRKILPTKYHINTRNCLQLWDL